MPIPSDSSWFDHPINVWWEVQIIKVFRKLMSKLFPDRHVFYVLGRIGVSVEQRNLNTTEHIQFHVYVTISGMTEGDYSC